MLGQSITISTKNEAQVQQLVLLLCVVDKTKLV